MVGYFATIFQKQIEQKSFLCGFVCFICFAFKNQEKAGEQTVEASVLFQYQRVGSFENLKHDTCKNPNAIIFSKNT